MQNGFEEDCQMDPRFTKHILPYSLYLNHATSLAFNCLLGFICIEVLSNRPHMFQLQWRKKYQPLNLLQVFYPSMSAKLTPQEYGNLGYPFGKKKRLTVDLRSAFYKKRLPCPRGRF